MQKANLRILSESVIKLIRRNALSNVKKIVLKTHAEDLAHIYERLKRDEQEIFLNILFETERLGEVLFELERSETEKILNQIETGEIAQIIRTLSSDDAADLLGLLSEERVQETLSSLRGRELSDLKSLLKFEEDTAGGIMTREFLAMQESTTVRDAIDIIHHAPKAEVAFYIYVINEEEKLTGVLSLRQLLIAPYDSQLKEIMERDVIKVGTDLHQSEAAKITAKYDLLSVPVVDSEDRLVGTITVDDIIDVIQDEATEDFYLMAGTDKQELVYGDQILKISRVRLPWLLINLGGTLFSGLILLLFDGTLREVIALTAFIPAIMAMGGNIGSQSSMITMRGLATGRVDRNRIKSVLWRELQIGIVIGSTCGILVGIIGSVLKMNPILGLVVGLSMTLAVTTAAILGALAPVVFEKAGIDPAIASGPIVTTTNDITGIVIYMALATLFLTFLK